MLVKQISVFLENKTGRLAEVTGTLGSNKINIRALSIADTTDFGILRLIVNNPAMAYQLLKEQGFTVSETDVIAVEIDDSPGGLSRVLRLMDENKINIEYLYAFLEKKEEAALVVFRVEEIERAIETLQKNNITVLKGAQVYEL
ncbi:ACT domain-containing protein [Desulfuribacillus alkaliarsenatis]|uniref:Amino acid-binding protein n=1 Tax=Desulfuribacillus alkaliarsenatis TaxID=766136 RepID=A0A1E5G4X9_9FIRM|nr:ACT domain-containing protein [Desulfuribacillus alkaliarsenatis]OEF98242.1 amino acid-binding protein [Desulfuribacillus alkaliarsenatis]